MLSMGKSIRHKWFFLYISDVGRSCLPTKMKTTCEEGEQGGYKGEVCTCDTDGCNGSDMTKFTIATGIMAAVAILKNMDMF